MNTGNPYVSRLRTAIESPTFQRQADDFWSEEERLDFLSWLAANPEAGDVIPGADGARKVRWTLPGIGKRGGARVIYFNYAEDGNGALGDDVRQGRPRKRQHWRHQEGPVNGHREDCQSH